jgi:hypothetical protein
MATAKKRTRKIERADEKSVSMPMAASMPSVSAAQVDREQLIAQEAYLRAERRGFEPGHEIEDWLEAERTVGAVATH